MTKTTVKTLTGELVVIEHYGEEDLKLEINKKFPELYLECQTIIYENKEECYVILDTIEDVIEIDLTYSPFPFYITTKKELIEDYSHTKFLNEYKNVKKHHPYLFTSSDTYEDFPMHHIIKAKLIHMKWYNKKSYNIYKDSFIYHPKYGFTTEEFMQTEHIKNNKFLFNIPSDDYSTYWFETLKDMMNFMKDKRMRHYTPYIFNSDDFLKKIQDKLEKT